MKILVVKLSAFGDIIHALPALDDLLARPEVSEVHWLVDKRYAFVGEIFPKQIKVHAIALKGSHPVKSSLSIIRQLRRIGFDVVLDLQGLIKSAVLAKAVKRRVFGIDSSHIREKPAAWLQNNVCFHPDERHVVQQYRRVAAAPFTDNWQKKPEKPIPYKAPGIDLYSTSIPAMPQLLEELGLTGQDYIVLHAAGGWETKLLPEKCWLAVANGLNDRGIKPVFSWGNLDEKDMAKNLADRSNGYALPERLNMSELVALLTGARAVVGADTGVLHLAAALGTPTVTFWGPSASWRSAPFSDGAQGAIHWHIESDPACGPCFKRTCSNFICMDAIQADAILGAIDDI